MASPKWIGTALKTYDLWTLTPGGTIEVGDLFLVTVGSKTVSIAAAGTTVASVCATVATALAALDSALYPEHAEYTFANATTSVTATANTAGIPGTITVATTESNGGAADGQTFVATHTTTGTGPNSWDNTANWSTGAIPVNADTPTIEGSDVSILYGLDQSAVSLTSLNILSTFTGTIGLPTRNSNGYAEYRGTYLQIGVTTINIGQGSGAKSRRIKHDAGSVACAWNVYGMSQPIETGIEALLVKGTSASNTLNVTEGTVGVAVYAGETADLSGLLRVGYEQNQASDAKVRCGSGVTLATVAQTGGQVEINSNMTTVTRTGGTMTHRGASTITTLNNFAGTFINESTGTFTTVLQMAEFDRRRVISSQTITTMRLYKGSKTYTPTQSSAPTFGVTYTNPVELIGCEMTDVTFIVGPNKKWTFADI